MGYVTDTAVVWKLKTRVGKYASPILVDGLIYTAAEESFVTCLEAEDRPRRGVGRDGVDEHDVVLAVDHVDERERLTLEHAAADPARDLEPDPVVATPLVAEADHGHARSTSSSRKWVAQEMQGS